MLNDIVTKISRWLIKILQPLMAAQQMRADRYLETWGYRWDDEKQNFY